MTITSIRIDLNSYVKLMSGLYFDFDVKADKKELIRYLFILFAADHPEEVSKYGTELLDEYLESNM